MLITLCQTLSHGKKYKVTALKGLIIKWRSQTTRYHSLEKGHLSLLGV